MHTCLLALLTVAPARGAELLARSVTVADGLPTNFVRSLGQDDDGYIWFGSFQAVSRFDGQRAQTWTLPTDTLAGDIEDLAPLADGSVVLRTLEGDVWHLLADRRFVPLAGPDGEPLRSTDIDRDGGDLVVASKTGVWRRAVGGAWELLIDQVEGRVPRRLGVGAAGLYVGSDRCWYRWRAGHALQALRTEGVPSFALEGPDGGAWLLTSAPAQVYREEHGQVRRVAALETPSLLGGAVVGDDLWYGDGRGLYVATPDGAIEHLPSGPGGLPTRGILMVDQEGSLWGAGFNGLSQVAAPEIRIWTPQDGMHGQTARYLAELGDRLWVTDWYGLSRLAPDGSLDHPTPLRANGRLCRVGDSLWTMAKVIDGPPTPTWLRWDAQGEATSFPAPLGVAWAFGCAQARDGGLWLATAGRLLHTDGLHAPQDRGPLPLDLPMKQSLLQTRVGDLWMSARNRACVLPGADFAGTWSCTQVDDGFNLENLHETERGQVWASTRHRGLMVWDGVAFVPHAGMDGLPLRDLRNIVASLRGGQWLMGLGAILRVLDRPDGIEVVEALPEWLGQSFSSIESLHESADGTLWLATNIGLVRIPARLRDAPTSAPRVLLTELQVDGNPWPGTDVELPRPDASLSVLVSAMSYRAPGLIRYRHRLDGGGWSPPRANPALELTALPAGQHVLELAATLDGVRWSELPVVLNLAVPARWYERGAAWALFAALALVVVVVVQRIQLRLQARLDELRARVAMDLHDELGAGMASMGLLAGLISDGLPPRQSQALAARIAEDANELGAGLSSIVWSLRPGHRDLAALLDYLEHRVQAILPGLGEENIGILSSPALSHTRVDPDVLRALQLVALEALHNVAKHARASRVWIHIERAGASWRLVVEDDGVGPANRAPTAPDRGLGLSSMAARMRAVGGRLEVARGDHGGTRVTATFRPRRRWWVKEEA